MKLTKHIVNVFVEEQKEQAILKRITNDPKIIEMTKMICFSNINLLKMKSLIIASVDEARVRERGTTILYL